MRMMGLFTEMRRWVGSCMGKCRTPGSSPHPQGQQSMRGRTHRSRQTGVRSRELQPRSAASLGGPLSRGGGVEVLIPLYPLPSRAALGLGLGEAMRV